MIENNPVISTGCVKPHFPGTWQRSYRGDLCATSGKNTLLPNLQKLIYTCRFACRIFNDIASVKTCGRLTMWQARYINPHPTPVGQRILTLLHALLSYLSISQGRVVGVLTVCF